MAIDDYTTLINPFYPLSGPQTCSGLDIEPVIAQSEGGGVFSWLASRRMINAFKSLLENLKDALENWVYSVCAYFVA